MACPRLQSSNQGQLSPDGITENIRWRISPPTWRPQWVLRLEFHALAIDHQSSAPSGLHPPPPDWALLAGLAARRSVGRLGNPLAPVCGDPSASRRAAAVIFGSFGHSLAPISGPHSAVAPVTAPSRASVAIGWPCAHGCVIHRADCVLRA